MPAIDAEVQAMFKEFEKSFGKEMVKALSECCVMVHAEAVKHVPVRGGKQLGQGVTAGRARAGLTWALEHVGDTLNGIIGGNVHYLPYLELGTRSIADGKVLRWKSGQYPVSSWPAKTERGGIRDEMPFIRPAIYDLKDKIEQRLIDAGRKAGPK